MAEIIGYSLGSGKFLCKDFSVFYRIIELFFQASAVANAPLDRHPLHKHHTQIPIQKCPNIGNLPFKKNTIAIYILAFTQNPFVYLQIGRLIFVDAF